MTRIRWGILATGSIAHTFTRDLVLAGFEVVAVGSRRRESAEAFAAEFGIARAHAGYRALVEDPGVDVVYIATPHPFHAENARLALAAGKHVLIEKPIAMSAAQAETIAELGRSTGLVVQEAMWTRFLPHMRRIMELVRTGAIGDVRGLSAEHTQNLPEDPGHRINALELGGGALLDLAIYPLSFAYQLFGRPEAQAAVATFTGTGVDSRVSTVFRYPGGQVASTLSASDMAGPNRATVFGSRGRIEIDGTWYAPTSFRVHDNDGRIIERFASDVPGRGMQYQAAEVERLIREGRSAGEVLSPEESVEIMRTLDEVRREIGLDYPGI